MQTNILGKPFSDSQANSKNDGKSSPEKVNFRAQLVIGFLPKKKPDWGA